MLPMNNNYDNNININNKTNNKSTNKRHLRSTITPCFRNNANIRIHPIPRICFITIIRIRME